MIHKGEKTGRKTKRSCLVNILTFVSSIILITSIFLTNAFSHSKTTGFSAELREWLILEVSTPSEKLRSADASGCSVSTTLDIKNTVVDVRVMLCVAHNQAVQLRVQALGDLTNPLGKTFPISNIMWQSSGEGFFNGVLDKDQSKIMASWTGPGSHKGTVKYQFLKTPEQSEGYSQTVVYCLAIL